MEMFPFRRLNRAETISAAEAALTRQTALNTLITMTGVFGSCLRQWECMALLIGVDEVTRQDVLRLAMYLEDWCKAHQSATH